MSQVILSPTWKLIPNSVSWPEKPEHWPSAETNFFEQEKYKTALTEASRHLVDIEEEDWEGVLWALRHTVAFTTVSSDPKVWIQAIKQEAKADTVYSIDAEFEVKMECHGSPIAYDPELNGPNDEPDDLKYRQIARLVKPKEKQNKEKHG